MAEVERDWAKIMSYLRPWRWVLQARDDIASKPRDEMVYDSAFYDDPTITHTDYRLGIVTVPITAQLPAIE